MQTHSAVPSSPQKIIGKRWNGRCCFEVISCLPVAGRGPLRGLSWADPGDRTESSTTLGVRLPQSPPSHQQSAPPGRRASGPRPQATQSSSLRWLGQYQVYPSGISIGCGSVVMFVFFPFLAAPMAAAVDP